MRHIDPTTIFAVGPSGATISRDDGANWQVLGRSPGYHTLNCVGRVIWAAGGEGRVGRTTLPISRVGSEGRIGRTTLPISRIE